MKNKDISEIINNSSGEQAKKLKQAMIKRSIHKNCEALSKMANEQTTKKYKLEDILIKCTEENKHDEVDWGKPMGNEIW